MTRKSTFQMASLVLPALLLTGCAMQGRPGLVGDTTSPAASQMASNHAPLAPRREPVVQASAEVPEGSPRDLRRQQVRSAASHSSWSSLSNCFS